MNEFCTDVELVSHECKWTLNNFMIHLNRAKSAKSQTELKSPFFYIGNDHHMKWHLLLKIYGIQNYMNSEIVVFAVCQLDKVIPDIWVEATTTLLKDDGKIFGKYYAVSGISKIEDRICIYPGMVERFSERSGLTNSNGGFTIVCQLKKVGDTITTDGNINIPKVIRKSLSCDFADLLQSQRFADVTFVFNDEMLYAHKIIMAWRSPVFAAMFEHSMQEQIENEVNIEDIDIDVFRGMLEYIYTNRVSALENIAAELLYAADKYGLDDLKEMCAVSIWKKITVDNAAEVYIFAHRHNLTQLMGSLQNFMETHIFDVMKTSGYELLQKEYPSLDLQLSQTLLKKYRNRQRIDEDRELTRLCWIL